ncbi:NAD(P)H-binding protein [Novosphingobium sp. ST904]|uniref:NAD(P)H-binding protein n=1 Tax=Novosphingobium sp. ST904 TaxID=1684385 RepID=UPI0006C8B0D9|nr:NAD(P)H-binding protein [Novosphingobium sp. ST904]KPH62553.1 NmrA family transcriptional regulator [Novosphingobium sp. ST904]TCM33092.1 NAD(P)H dehydrogenase (quinone) [Novosphingobium sp. ST904]
MGKIIVTGASGAFGKAAAGLLLERCAPEDLIFLTRTPEKLKSLAEAGAQVRAADFDDPTSLPGAMADGERMLLISTARVGTRVGQHRHAVEAAVQAGVRHIVYTSLISADAPDNPAIVRHDHRATEEIVEASGAQWTHLRDSQYSEAIALAMVIPALAAGHKPDNCADGKVGFVSRDDCVASAVGVLTQDGHGNRAYTLTGPELLSIPEALAMASGIAGKPITVEHVDDEAMFAYFDFLGVPRHASDIVPDGPIPWSSDDMVTFGTAIREGFFARCTDHVERLSGRPPRSLRDVMLQHRGAWPQ